MIEFGQNQLAITERYYAGIAREAARRLALGVDVHLDNHGWIALDCRPDHHQVLATSAQMASTYVATALDDELMVFSDREDVMHMLSPRAMIDLFVAGSEYVGQVQMSAHILRAMPSRPVNLDDDSFWPAANRKP